MKSHVREDLGANRREIAVNASDHEIADLSWRWLYRVGGLAALLAAGETMLATFHGTAFHVGINLFSVYFLIVPLIMLRSNIFGRMTAYAGIAAAILNWGLYVPGGTGLFLLTLSVIPLAVWNVLIARRLLQLGRVAFETRSLEIPT